MSDHKNSAACLNDELLQAENRRILLSKRAFGRSRIGGQAPVPRLWNCDDDNGGFFLDTDIRKALSPECIGRRNSENRPFDGRRELSLDAGAKMQCAALEAGFLLEGKVDDDAPASKLLGECARASKHLSEWQDEDNAAFKVLQKVTASICPSQGQSRTLAQIPPWNTERELKRIRRQIETYLENSDYGDNSLEGFKELDFSIRRKLPFIIAEDMQLSENTTLGQTKCDFNSPTSNKCGHYKHALNVLERLLVANMFLNQALQKWSCPGNVDKHTPKQSIPSIHRSIQSGSFGVCSVVAIPSQIESSLLNELSTTQVRVHPDYKMSSHSYRGVTAFCQTLEKPSSARHAVQIVNSGGRPQGVFSTRFDRPSDCTDTDFIRIPRWRQLLVSKVYSRQVVLDQGQDFRKCAARAAVNQGDCGRHQQAHVERSLFSSPVSTLGEFRSCSKYRLCQQGQPFEPVCLDESLLRAFK